MTREEEIEQAMRDSVAETIYASGWGMTPQATDLLECAFTKGAKWADANPQFSKEEFIEKACKWLNRYASDYAFSVYDEDDACSVSMDLVDDFKEAMEQL